MLISRKLYVGYPVRSDSLIPNGIMSSSSLRNLKDLAQVSYISAGNIDSQGRDLQLSNTSQPSNLVPRRLSSYEPDSMRVLEHASPKRLFTPRNQMVGGMFLHLTRHAESVSCTTRFSKMARACHNARTRGSIIQSKPLYRCTAVGCPPARSRQLRLVCMSLKGRSSPGRLCQ